MLIIEQDRDSVTNLDHFGTIELCGNRICSYRWNSSGDLDENEMACYETPERAIEVFDEFLSAVLREDKVFTMPEE